MNRVYIWVKYGDSRSVEVDAATCRNVDGLIELVKVKLCPKLDSVAVDDITICTSSTAENGKLNPGLSLTELVSLESFKPNSSQRPLVIKVTSSLSCSTSPSTSKTSLSSNPKESRMKRWEKLNAVLDKSKHSKKRKLADDDVSTPYSKVTWGEVDEVFDDEKVKFVLEISEFDNELFKFLSKYLSIVWNCYNGSLTFGNEAKRLHLIAPIVMCVVSCFNDVIVEVEKDLDGNRVNAHGHFEFILIRGKKRICIIETKEEQFKKGMAQNLLRFEVAVDLDNSKEVYGIVINFEKWIFIKSSDDKIEVDDGNVIGFISDGSPVEVNLKQVVGKFVSLLK